MIPLLRAIESSKATGDTVTIAMTGAVGDFERFFYAVVDCTGGAFTDDGVEAWGSDWHVKVVIS